MSVVLIAITDFERVPADVLFERAARLGRAAVPGSVAFQLRDRTQSTRALLALGERLLAVARGTQQTLIVNDRLDLALLLGADALHLGEASVDTAAARRLFGNKPIFRACHEVTRAGALDADAVVLSPILAERKGNPALGLSALERARQQLRERGRTTALYALGGVDVEGASACLRAGADGIAAIGAAFDHDDPAPLLNALAIARNGTP